MRWPRNKKLRQIFAVLCNANLLWLLLMLRRPKQAGSLLNEFYRSFLRSNGKAQWYIAKDIFEIFPEALHTQVTLEHKPGMGINTDIRELVYMAIITQILQPDAVFEIGTFRGRTALNFALNSPANCTIYTLDLPLGLSQQHAGAHNADQAIKNTLQNNVGEELRTHPLAHKVKQLYGNSIEFDFSPYYKQISLVFIDGSHQYDYVISDIQNALKMLKSGGVIILHDFGNLGDYFDVTQAILDSNIGNKFWQIGSTELAVYRSSHEDMV